MNDSKCSDCVQDSPCHHNVLNVPKAIPVLDPSSSNYSTFEISNTQQSSSQHPSLDPRAPTEKDVINLCGSRDGIESYLIEASISYSENTITTTNGLTTIYSTTFNYEILYNCTN